MKDTMTEFSFCDWFRKSENRKNQFSFDGLKALYDYLINLEDDTGVEMEFDPVELCCDYLINLEDDTGVEMEFDPVELCCDYSEYKNLEELKNNYSDIENFEDLQNETSVIKIPNTERFIIQNY